MSKQDILDQWFLREPYVDRLLELADPWLTGPLILEPSCGNGDILKKLKLLPRFLVIANDLDPEMADKNDAFNEDFLAHKWFTSHPREDVAVVGGPPYGPNSTLAIDFFNHSASFANVIAMILPKSFKRNGGDYRSDIQGRLNKNFHLVVSEDLPKGAFYRPGNEDEFASNKSCIQVWVYRDEPRSEYVPKSTSDFHFVTPCNVFKNPNIANFAFFRRSMKIVDVDRAIADLKVKTDPLKNSKYVFISGKSQVRSIFEQIDWKSIGSAVIGAASVSQARIVDAYVDHVNAS